MAKGSTVQKPCQVRSDVRKVFSLFILRVSLNSNKLFPPLVLHILMRQLSLTSINRAISDEQFGRRRTHSPRGHWTEPSSEVVLAVDPGIRAEFTDGVLDGGSRVGWPDPQARRADQPAQRGTARVRSLLMQPPRTRAAHERLELLRTVPALDEDVRHGPHRTGRVLTCPNHEMREPRGQTAERALAMHAADTSSR